MTRRLLSTQAASAAEDLAAGTLTETTIEIQSTTVTIDDKNIELGSTDSPSDSTADGGGITLKGTTDKTILWENDDDSWHFNQGIDVVGAGSFAGAEASLSQGIVQVGVDSGGDPGGELMFHTDDYVGIRCAHAGALPLAVKPSGNVGIGTTAPAVALDVIGIGSFAGAEASLSQGNVQIGVDSGGDPGGEVMFHTDDYIGIRCANSGAPPFAVKPSGNVGIGDVAPGTQLQMSGTAPYVTLKNSTAENTAGGCESKIIFEDHADVTLAQVEGSHSGSSDDTKGKLILSTHTGSALTAAVTIDDTQDVTFAADISVSGEVQTANIGYTDGDNAITIVDGGDCTFAADVTVTGEVIANAGIDVKNGDTGAGYVNFYEDSDNGTNSVTVIGPASTADVTLTLPSATDTLVGKATTDTLTNKTLTAPKIADDGYIADANGNEQLVFVQTASAVNHWAMTNATNGTPNVILQATGTTSDVNAFIKPQGEGVVVLQMTHANGTTAIKGASSGDAVLELQPDDGTAADQWTVSALDDGHFTIASKISGSFADMLEITPNATAANSSSALAGSLRTTGKLTSAGQVLAYAAKTANYTTTATDHVIVASGSGTVITLLENAPAGTVYTIKRVDASNEISVSRDTGDTIDGANTYALENNYDTVTVMSDGANYHVIAEVVNEGGGGP